MQISKPVRKHASLASRQRILRACRHTTLSQREFAAKVGTRVATLNKWRKQPSAPPPPDRPQFVALPNLVPKATLGPIYRLVPRTTIKIHHCEEKLSLTGLVLPTGLVEGLNP